MRAGAIEEITGLRGSSIQVDNLATTVNVRFGSEADFTDHLFRSEVLKLRGRGCSGVCQPIVDMFVIQYRSYHNLFAWDLRLLL